MPGLQEAGLVSRVRRRLGGVHAGAIRPAGEVRRLDALATRVVTGAADAASAAIGTDADDQRDEDDARMARRNLGDRAGGVRFFARRFNVVVGVGRRGVGCITLGVGVSDV